MSPRFIDAKEYAPIDFSELTSDEQERAREIARRVGDPTTDNSPYTTLNLHMDQKDKLRPHAHWFIGQVWLNLGARPDNRVILRVTPKIEGIDSFKMYVDCISHPTVCGHLRNDCVEVFWEETPIPLRKDFANNITPLIVARYLTLLHDLCRKHLRLAVMPMEANLNGRIKGRPLVQQTLRRNLSRGRADRTYCRFHVQSRDNLHNQILLTALRQGLKHLDQTGMRLPELSRLAAFSEVALEGVTLRNIRSSDWQQLHYGGFLRPYRELHRWARLILRLLGSDPFESLAENQNVELPPFAINMNELFERYCEVVLRGVPGQTVWAGYSDQRRSLGEQFPVRPDFLVADGTFRWIVDAKYKEDWTWKGNAEDVRQVMTYSRHLRVLDKLRELEPGTRNTLPHIVILYPGPGQSGNHRQVSLSATSSPDFAGKRVLNDFEVKVVRTSISLPKQ